MILSFTQTINDKPNYFIEKIWSSIPDYDIDLYDLILMDHKIRFGRPWDFYSRNCDPAKLGLPAFYPKLHTIRDYRITKTGERAAKQWKAGDKIHPAINNRTKNYFQFAPVIECKSVQIIKICRKSGQPEITIDGKEFYYWDAEIENGYPNLHKLAVNDGFDSVRNFLNYFKDGERPLIHWTDLKY